MAAQRGDTDAAGELFRRTRVRAHRAARVFCRDTDADDAVAEGLTRALSRIDQLHDPAAVETWMIRCAVRAALDLVRTQRQITPTGDFGALGELVLPAAESAAERAMAELERAAMTEAWHGLTPDRQWLLHLRYHCGLTVADIAVTLGRPPGTVRRLCVEARRAAAEQFLGHHLQPASGACGRVRAWLCQEPYRPSSPRAQRQAVAHLRGCPPCRDRQAELATVLSELGYRRS